MRHFNQASVKNVLKFEDLLQYVADQAELSLRRPLL